MTSKTDTTPEETPKSNAGDVVNSLTGFEEIAIEKWFDRGFQDMGDSPMALRALVFVLETRTGKKPVDAYQDAMSAPFSSLGDYFDTNPGEDLGEA